MAAAGALATALALRVAVGRGPLRARQRLRWSTRAWTGFLIGYALLGDTLLRTALGAAPDVHTALSSLPGALSALAHGHPAPVLPHLPRGAHAPATAAVLALALAVLPAACCARLYAAGATRRVGYSRDLAEFTARARPLLLTVFALYLCALGLLLALTAALLHQDVASTDYAAAGALGALLMPARLLMVHGFTRAPAPPLAAAGGRKPSRSPPPSPPACPAAPSWPSPSRRRPPLRGPAPCPRRPAARPPWSCWHTPAAPSPGPRPTPRRTTRDPHTACFPARNTGTTPEGERQMTTTLTRELARRVAR